jgi:predicted flap endonuclease-1-like 5' DNA nuclease
MAHEIGALDARLDSIAGEPVAAAVPVQRTPLSERIVALPPPQSMEAFRTKVKVKAPATATLPTLHGDDLTRIRGIDAALAVRLAAVGVNRFAQIAGWEQNDVQNLSQILDLGRTISRQNWIEQAALLSGPSLVTAKPARSPIPLAGPAPDQRPPVVPVPVVPPISGSTRFKALPPIIPVPVVPEVAPAQPALPTLPQPAPVMPRVVAVDSPGDAKFHHAVIHLLPAQATAELWLPVIPVPEVPMRVLFVAHQPPFQVPVPVVPERTAIDDSEFNAQPPALPIVEPTVDAVGLEHVSAALTLAEPLSEDDTLASQLQAAVTAAADDRAVAATIDLLSAFAPPPVVDETNFRKHTAWPPTFSTSVSTSVPDVVEAEADIAFTRWVPPTPLAVPVPPFTNGRTADAWSPMPWARSGTQAATPVALPEQQMRAAAQAVAASAAVVHGPAPAATAMWPRPRDRWSPDQTAPVAAPAVPEPSPVAPLEPVVPTMLDRLASLEAELSALAANDQPRAHAAGAPSATPGAPAQVRSSDRVPNTPDLSAEQSRAMGRRAGVRPEPTQIAQQIRPEPPLPGLPESEADVMIVPRGGDSLEIRSITSGPSVGTLEQRMRRARPAPEVDVETYAGYHAAISEASVEIVRRDTHTRAVVFSDNADATNDGASRGRDSTVRKFFKALKGDVN